MAKAVRHRREHPQALCCRAKLLASARKFFSAGKWLSSRLIGVMGATRRGLAWRMRQHTTLSLDQADVGQHAFDLRRDSGRATRVLAGLDQV
jgi:hypothetical protein